MELVSGYLAITQADEIGMYVRAWERLFTLAVFGDRVRTLIRAALDG